MTRLFLDFWGVAARLECRSGGVLEDLRRDFAYFESAEGSRTPDVELILELRAPGAWAEGGWPLFAGAGYRARRRAGRRLILYEDGAAALYDYATGRGRLACPRPGRLHELAYLAVLSRVGEALDRRGLHRVHALGFSWEGEGGLLLLPSGGGKTTLALRLLERPRMRLISEDTPLVDGDGAVRAFPLRLGLRPDADLAAIPARWRRPVERLRHGPKTAVDLPYFRERLSRSAPARWLLLGSRRGGRAELRPACAGRAAAALALNLVAGWGVAQMSEYMIRPGAAGLAGLGSIARSRARAALALTRRCEAWRFELGEDPGAAAAALERFLDEATLSREAASAAS